MFFSFVMLPCYNFEHETNALDAFEMNQICKIIFVLIKVYCICCDEICCYFLNYYSLLWLFWRYVYFGFPSSKSANLQSCQLCFEIIKVHAICDFTKKLLLTESFVVSRHSHSETKYHAKSMHRCGGGGTFRILSSNHLVKLVAAVIFAKYLILEFGRVLNMLEFVKIDPKFRICLNTLGFSKYLNVPEYARVMNMFQ